MSAALKIGTTNGAVKTRKSVKTKKKAVKAKLSKGDKIRAGAFFALAVCGLAVSLPHLASEVGLLTGSGILSAWLIAVILDCGMVVCKAHLSDNGPCRNVAWTVLGSCTLVSVVLNCHAFLSHSTEGFGTVAAVGFGVFLPLFNLALSYLGSAILLGHRD